MGKAEFMTTFIKNAIKNGERSLIYLYGGTKDENINTEKINKI